MNEFLLTIQGHILLLINAIDSDIGVPLVFLPHGSVDEKAIDPTREEVVHKASWLKGYLLLQVSCKWRLGPSSSREPLSLLSCVQRCLELVCLETAISRVA